ncbi:hypothetical protein [Paludisphaera sp.]|uniref:hypothetical protein n=1 Tax=Paludisphaera sp. TaxID=2017432 RepID=UPI00301CFCF4
MRIRHLAPAVALGLAVLAAPPSARAQGWGWGWGGGIAMPWVPSPTNTVNAFALQNAARAGAPRSNNVYAHNPNSYMYNLRDNGLVQQQSARGPAAGSRAAASLARRSAGDAPAPSPGAIRPEPRAADAQPARTAPAPLASFFDAAGALIWPADSPYEGELKERRDTSDRAVAAVRSEVDARGVAPIPLAAEARQKLLDYGRPALQEIRSTSTPRVSETFHEFLLGLYDSIAAATIPPAPSE